MSPIQLEYLQLIPLLIYVIVTWDKETAPTKAGLLTWLCVLGWDIMILQGDRPAYIKWMYNLIDAGAGWVIVYAYYRQPIHRVHVKLLALLVTLSK